MLTGPGLRACVVSRVSAVSIALCSTMGRDKDEAGGRKHRMVVEGEKTRGVLLTRCLAAVSVGLRTEPNADVGHSLHACFGAFA